MSRRDRLLASIAGGAVLALLLAAQRISSRHLDETWNRVGEWRHDLSLYAALALAGILLATPAAQRWSSRRRALAPGEADPVEAGRSLLIGAGQGAAVAFAVFVVSVPVVVLAVAERPTAALVLAAALAIAAFALRWAAWPLGVASMVITGASVWGTLAFDSVDQTAGPLIVEPLYPSELYFASAPDGLEPSGEGLGGWSLPYRRGSSPVLMDLRHLRLNDGATVRISARSDLDRVVVALPERRCIALKVHFKRLTRRPPEAYRSADHLMGVTLDKSRPAPVQFPPALSGWDEAGVVPVGGLPDREPDTADGPTLVGFGDQVYGEQGTWERRVEDPSKAATVELDVQTGTQLIVRDYPSDFSLGVIRRADVQHFQRADETAVLSWPLAPGATFSGPPARFPAPPDSAASARRMANRVAGPCATEEDRARRWARIGDGTIPQPGDTSRYVNGLGQQRRVTVERAR